MQWNDPLLNLATILLAGCVGGEVLGRLRLPKVTGWIGTGIALRALGLPGLEPGDLSKFSPFANFVLGYIAFTVGASLHVASLRNTGKRLGLLLLAEATVTPTVVFFLLHFVGGMGTQASMLLAAVAIAGAPGTTVLVSQEARSKGILTRTLIAAIGLIDMVAVGAFVFAVSMFSTEAGALLSWSDSLAVVGQEIGFSFGVGGSAAVVVLLLGRRLVGPAFVGPMMVSVILAAWGAATVIGVSPILACTFAGIAISNLQHDVARTAQSYLKPFGGVLFAVFYTLAGMRLDFGLVVPMAGFVALYFLARLAGKSLGAYLAMRFSGSTKALRRYLGVSLMPHGGVAVGLLLIVQERADLAAIADTVVAVGLATLAVNQLVGPSATRFALGRAGETGKDRPRLLDFLSEQRIVTGLTGATKKAVIEALADRLYATSSLPVSKAQFIEEVLERERVASTCLGEGFMIPHAILEDGDDIKGVLGLSKSGLDLGAPDGRPVHAVVLLATPRTDRARHLEVLAAFAKAVTGDSTMRGQLYAARSPAHAYEVIHADDSEELNYFLDDAKEKVGV